MAGIKESEGKEYQPEHQRHRDSARGAMGELDYGGDLRGVRNQNTLAKWPVLAATGARTGGSHHCSPEDHQNVEGQDRPGIHCEATSPRSLTATAHRNSPRIPRNLPSLHSAAQSFWLTLEYIFRQRTAAHRRLLQSYSDISSTAGRLGQRLDLSLVDSVPARIGPPHPSSVSSSVLGPRSFSCTRGVVAVTGKHWSGGRVRRLFPNEVRGLDLQLCFGANGSPKHPPELFPYRVRSH